MAGRQKGGLVVWAVVGLLVVAMAGFGLNGQIANRNADTVMTVGDIKISSQEYANALSNNINQFSRQQGRQLSFDEAKLIGIPAQTQRQLIFDAAMKNLFEQSKLEVTDEALLREVRTIPSFQDTDGNFSRRNLELFLDTQGMSEDELLSLVRSDVENQTAIDILAGADVPLPNIVDRLSDKIGEKRAIDYLRIDPTKIDVPATTDDEARNEYEVNTDNYMAAPINRYALAYAIPDIDAITDAQIQSAYETRKDDFGKEATLDYDLLNFDSEAEARAITDSTAFDAEVEARGLTANDVHFSDGAADAVPAELIVALDQGGNGLYGPYETDFGYAVYRVNAYQPAENMTIDEARPILAIDVARDNLATQLRDEFDTINAMVDAGSDPETIANATSLTYLDWSSNDAPIPGLSDDPNFIGETTAAAVGETRPLVKLENGGLAYFTLEATDEPQPLVFNDVKDDIINDLDTQKRREAALAMAQSIADGFAAGDELGALATDDAVEFNRSPLATQNALYQSLPFILAFEMFNNDQDTAVSIDDQDNAYVAVVTDIAGFDPASDGDLRDQVKNSVSVDVRNAILEGFYQGATENLDILINRDLMNSVEAQF